MRLDELNIKERTFKVNQRVHEHVLVTPAKDEDPLRVVVVTLIDEQGEVGSGASVCSPEDVFEYKIGAAKARSRAVKALNNKTHIDHENIDNITNLDEYALGVANDYRYDVRMQKIGWIHAKIASHEQKLEKLAQSYGITNEMVLEYIRGLQVPEEMASTIVV